MPRRILGHEALALQGVPIEHTIAYGMSERMAMCLAGNAFCAGSFCAAFIAGMISSPIPTHRWGTDPHSMALPCDFEDALDTFAAECDDATCSD